MGPMRTGTQHPLISAHSASLTAALARGARQDHRSFPAQRQVLESIKD